MTVLYYTIYCWLLLYDCDIIQIRKKLFFHLYSVTTTLYMYECQRQVAATSKPKQHKSWYGRYAAVYTHQTKNPFRTHKNNYIFNHKFRWNVIEK